MHQLAGTVTLVRLVLRRDRLALIAWVSVLAILPLLTVAAFAELFPDDSQRQIFFLTTASQPSYAALLGPGFGPSLGGLSVQRAGLTFVFAALASVLTIVRHTRAEEEAGRRELLGATVVGRQAPLTAALVVVLGAHTLVGAISALGLWTLGLPVAGSVVFGVALMLTGWIYAAIAAVAAQLTEGAGAARGIALGILGATYLARALGDAGGNHGALSWVSWLSPIGWLQRSRAFEGDRWLVLLMAVVVFVALAVTAYSLSAKRDVGAGVFPRRLGRPSAAASLASPFMFAWRLHRTRLWAWSLAFAVAGVMIGMVTRDVARAVEANTQLRELIRQLAGDGAIADAYLSATTGFAAFVAAAYAIQSALHLRFEEESLRGELILTAAVPRERWALSHVVFALGGPTVALGVFGAMTGLVYGLMIDDVASQVSRVTLGALGQLPAVWFLAGITAALFGAAPRHSSLAWVFLATSVFLSQFGPLLELPSWALDLSPFAHAARLGTDVTVTPLALLVLFSAAAIGGGLTLLRRRDFGT